MPLLDLLVPNASADMVAVLDQDFNQLFGDARPMKAMVNESAEVMQHPVETGVKISDHVVFLPTEIELGVFLTSRGNVQDYRSVYQQIKQVYLSNQLITVQTRTDSYPSMLITAIPHDESGDMFDAVMVAIKLQQVIFVTPQFGALPESKVKNKTKASTVAKGEQQTTDRPSAVPSSDLLQIFQ